MSMNTNEVREYIYKNFTPQDIQKAILYYHERTGADLSISKLEVEKIYAQRQQEGRVLPMPKEWTPTGQKYITGKKLFDLGIAFLVISILIMLIITGYGYHDFIKRTNEISESDRQYLLDKGYQEYRTDGEAFEIIGNYHYLENKRTFQDLYLFRPEGKEDLCLGVLSTEWWYHFDSDMGSGLDIFYAGTPTLDTVETDNGTSYEVMIVDLNNVVAGYGIPSENANMLKMMMIIIPIGIGIPILLVAVVMIIAGRSMMKKNKI